MEKDYEGRGEDGDEDEEEGKEKDEDTFLKTENENLEELGTTQPTPEEKNNGRCA